MRSLDHRTFVFGETDTLIASLATADDAYIALDEGDSTPPVAKTTVKTKKDSTAT